jgi:hypothetical protein
MELLDTFKQLDAKQKMTAAITAVLLMFLLYFAYDTFAGGGSDGEASPSSVKKPASLVEAEDAPDTFGAPAVQEHQPPKQANVTQMAMLDPVSRPRTSMSDADAQLNSDEVMKQPVKQPDVEQLAFLQQTKQMQAEYLSLVNEYQLTQLQQKVEEAKAQISDSRLKATMSSAKQQQLVGELEKKGQMLMTPSIGGGVSSNTDADALVQVVYVGERRGQWTALLSEGGAYFEVRVGTRLSDDWRVVNITGQGVILERKNQRKLLRMPKTVG